MNKYSKNITFIEKEVKDSIMATDVYICVATKNVNQNVVDTIRNDIERCFDDFRMFEAEFSRFLHNNQLSKFNEASGEVKVSQDLFNMLKVAKKYQQITNGYFDISIYPNLINEGYAVSSLNGFIGANQKQALNTSNLDELVLDEDRLVVFKKEGLRVDLGGLGKGFIADNIVEKLKNKYENFVVDAGGDIYYHGVDLKNNYDYWACEVEDPNGANTEMPLLTLRNMGVATSGINRRKWLLDGVQKNHIINPMTGKSLETNLMVCAVVAKSTVEADILAKSILLMGKDSGLDFADARKVATLIVDEDSAIYQSKEMEQYVWKA